MSVQSIKFTAQGASHEFDVDKLTFAEGRALERVTGSTVAEFFDVLVKGSLTALQALVWVACKRDQPTLTFADLDDWVIADVVFEDPDDSEESEVPTSAVVETA
jgi:hypothetical protein